MQMRWDDCEIVTRDLFCIDIQQRTDTSSDVKVWVYVVFRFVWCQQINFHVIDVFVYFGLELFLEAATPSHEGGGGSVLDRMCEEFPTIYWELFSIFDAHFMFFWLAKDSSTGIRYKQNSLIRGRFF